jgi:nucleoside-diphosphate-sugar epimerase
LIFGGTGSIGRAVLRELVAHGHEVIALARSAASAAQIVEARARPLSGNLLTPEYWLGELPALDAVVQVACAFTEDDEITEQRLLDMLLPRLVRSGKKVRFLYTGGCWLYGPAGDVATTESAAFDPLPAFAWVAAHVERLLGTTGIEPLIVHPAMVYEPSAGVFGRLHAEALEGRDVRIVGSERVRWPLVHAADLATLYRLILESAPPGETYLGAAIDGIAVGSIARAFMQMAGLSDRAPAILTERDAVIEFGHWASGYARDQLQSGAKARERLGWQPRHLDPLAEIAQLRP